MTTTLAKYLQHFAIHRSHGFLADHGCETLQSRPRTGPVGPSEPPVPEKETIEAEEAVTTIGVHWVNKDTVGLKPSNTFKNQTMNV